MATPRGFAKGRVDIIEGRPDGEPVPLSEVFLVFVLPFPGIDPVLISTHVFGIELAIRWYALAYIAGLLIGWRYVAWLCARPALWGGEAPMSPARTDDLLTWMVLGVILGGRLGYVLFYQPGYYAANPGQILAVWSGGMSFHGGLLGVATGVIGFALKNGMRILSVGDAVSAATPIGLFFGRIAQFHQRRVVGAAVARALGGDLSRRGGAGVSAGLGRGLRAASVAALRGGAGGGCAVRGAGGRDSARGAGAAGGGVRAVPDRVFLRADFRRAFPAGGCAVRSTWQSVWACDRHQWEHGVEHGAGAVAADDGTRDRTGALGAAAGLTELARLIAARIAAEGPMRFDVYMGLCLGHPRLGYYATRDPLGAAGDFTTGPEISQMFGEMIGAWLAQVWADQGRPAPVVLAELGPGRGTLMRDLLRVLGRVGMAPDVWLVETGAVLRARQAEVLGRAVHWARDLGGVPKGPLLLVANEFFDALPVRQFQRVETAWRERLVGPGLASVWGPPRLDADLDARFMAAPDGAVVEVCALGERIAREVAARIAAHGGAALIVDYGAWDGTGDTVQAVKGHGYADPMAAPGEADLTAHVRFRALAEAAARSARALGPVVQGVFLERLGITARALTLAHGRGAGRGGGGRGGASALDPSAGNGKPVPGARVDIPSRSRSPRIRRMTLEVLTSDLLADARHGFFTRKGGASSGIFAGLNCGIGSTDQRDAVGVNRARVAQALDLPPARLLSLRQVHSAQVAVAGPQGWQSATGSDGRPEADAAVTDQPGIAVSVLTADCAPVLLYDAAAGVVGAAHAGWRGALNGVIEAAVAAMERLGAVRGQICAAVGPAISQRAYEVGPEFFERFRSEAAGFERFFVPGAGDRLRFDLPGFVLHRLREAGVQAEWTGHCTYQDPARFYSFRRARHEGAPGYGRLISAIRL